MELKFDSCGRMEYNPEIHFNQGLPWNEEDLEYLIEWYDIIGLEEMSLAIGRTEKTIGNKVCVLRKRGLMKPKNSKNKRRLIRSGEVG